MSVEQKLCSITGCGKPLKAKGYCGNHYKRFIELPKKKAEQTALSKVAKQQQASQRMSERASNLTMAQLEKIFLTPCRTEKDLKNYIKYFFNLHLPDHKVSRYADTTPFHAIWEVYDICVNSNNPQNVQELLYVAGRGSGKCVQKDSIIKTLHGPKYIQNVRPGDIVWTGWSWRPVVEWFDEGIKDGVSISVKDNLRNGPFSLTGSLKHRIQAVSESGHIEWRHMKDLKSNDIVYISAHDNVDVDVASEDFKDGWFVGATAGDGAIPKIGNTITFVNEDSDALLAYENYVVSKFNAKIRRYDTGNAKTIKCTSAALKQHLGSYMEGILCYDKRLITLQHSYSFLAGFIAGIMDTDGSWNDICLANKDLVYQISQILSMFGVRTSVREDRRKPKYSVQQSKLIRYYQCEITTRLPDCLLPVFSKRASFIKRQSVRRDINRYPIILVKKIIDKILNVPGLHLSNKDLYAFARNNNRKFISGTILDRLIEFCRNNKWLDDVDALLFIRGGYFYTIDSVTFDKHYFYDLEVDTDHAYWSNGFISHNTLGMAIAELLVLLHDQRDVVHVGAILSQAKRCYEYQQKFLLSERIKPLVIPPKTQETERILEKFTMEKSVFNVIGEKVTLEVLPCTLRACLVSSTTSTDAHGTIRSLADFKPGDLIKDTTGFVEVIDNQLEDAECIRIELDDGRTIEGTLDHKVWTQRGWVELQHLTEDDDIPSLESAAARA